LEIITSKSIAEFLALLNGKRTAQEIFTKLGVFNPDNAENLIDFLLNQHLITEQDESVDLDSRYVRQIAYLDDMVLDRRGCDTQTILSSKKIVILGCGAVTGNIAETLVRAGILNFVLVDDKYFQKSNLSRHLFARISDVGESKVEVLANYLKNIDSRIKVTVFTEKLVPHSNLSKWISDDTSLVINGCDEPYIGHTSIKLGRYLQAKHIPMYVMGGFDAHLMSSGELVYPPHTPCIDCIQNTFSNALSDWKPIYNRVEDIQPLIKDVPSLKIEDSLIYDIGGSGGLSMMSGYSAFFSCLKIIHFLAGDSKYNFSVLRYEYLPNRGELTSFRLLKQENCDVCNK
jgi:molybdopterin/thiamine biosynthesis adenylyltransferase